MGQIPHACELTSKGLAWALSGHPWVYRDDLVSVAGEHGDVVRVEREGRCLGSAFLSLRSKIALRFIERSATPHLPDDAFWHERLARAGLARAELAGRTDAFRVVHGESDGLPGLVVDRYGPVAVVQTATAGAERLLPFLARELPALLGVSAVIARNDAAVREKEGLAREVRALCGDAAGLLWVHEEGPAGRIDLPVDPLAGQKTGAFLDQRENRWRTAELARGRMLDAFCYSGAFALHAARRVERALCLDSSEPALALCQAAAARNGLANVETVRANAFDFLKAAVGRGERFDTIVLDPPAFAKNRGELRSALRGYRELNRRAMEIVAPAGLLVTCSCSYNLGEQDFLDMLRHAAGDARAEFRLLERRGQASDHPVLLGHPESAYLKCAFLLKQG